MFTVTEKVKIVTYVLNSEMHFLDAATHHEDVESALISVSDVAATLQRISSEPTSDEWFRDEFIDRSGVADALQDVDDEELANNMLMRQVREYLVREGFIEE